MATTVCMHTSAFTFILQQSLD